jgi:hypothetical protein
LTCAVPESCSRLGCMLPFAIVEITSILLVPLGREFVRD